MESTNLIKKIKKTHREKPNQKWRERERDIERKKEREREREREREKERGLQKRGHRQYNPGRVPGGSGSGRLDLGNQYGRPQQSTFIQNISPELARQIETHKGKQLPKQCCDEIW